MGNLVLNKSVQASNSIQPYVASRALDGNNTPLSRWLSNVPSVMVVDMGDVYWIGRWVCKHMSYVGWDSRYRNQSYALYGSLDGVNWTMLDSVNGNTAAVTNREFTVSQWRYVKLYVTSGLSLNTQLSGVVELEVYEYPAPVSSSKLQSLTVSSGSLTPTFNEDVLSYSVSVTDAVTSVTVTPTSIDGGTITVDGQAVISGEASQSISLALGENTIQIEVTSRIGAVKTMYTVMVNRVLNLDLSSLLLTYFNRGFSEVHTVTMTSGVTTYSDAIIYKGANVKITPTAEDATVTINVNGEVLTSGQESQTITVQTGDNTIPIIVSKNGYTETKAYTLNINRASS